MKRLQDSLDFSSNFDCDINPPIYKKARYESFRYPIYKIDPNPDT